MSGVSSSFDGDDDGPEGSVSLSPRSPAGSGVASSIDGDDGGLGGSVALSPRSPAVAGVVSSIEGDDGVPEGSGALSPRSPAVSGVASSIDGDVDGLGGFQSLCRLDRLPCLASDDDVGSPDYFDGSPADPVCRSLSFGVRTGRFIGVVASYPVLFSGSPCTSEVDLVGSPVFKHQFDKLFLFPMPQSSKVLVSPSDGLHSFEL